LRKTKTIIIEFNKMKQDKEYFVFISYSSLDNEWAIWLRHELEHYHLPASFNGRTDVRDNLRKVFRDRDELSAGPEWDEQVQKALEDTNNLIVICSPNSAKSDAVNKEIETFIALGKEDHIFPFIVEGDRPEDCFPKALRRSKLAGDIKKDGSPNIAFVKIVAGMLNVSFSELWNRYEIEKAEEERKIREERDKLLRAQSRFISKTVLQLSQSGDNHLARRLCLEIVPSSQHPDYPYTPDAESALRTVMKDNVFTFLGHLKYKEIFTVQFSPDGKSVVSASKDNTVKIWDVNTGKCKLTITGKSDFHTSASYSPDGKYIALASRDNFIHIVDSLTGNEVKHLDGQSFILESIVFSPNGRRLASVSRDDILQVWDIEKGESIFTSKNAYAFFSPKYNSNRLSPNIFSPDGKYILIPGDKSLNIWDIDNNIPRVINDVGGKIKNVSFSPNGSYIMAVSDNDTIYIWDTQSTKCIHAYKDNVRSLKTVLFAHNDSSLYICSESDSAYDLYSLDIESGQKTEYGNLSFPVQSVYISKDTLYVAGSVIEKLFVKELALSKPSKLLHEHCDSVNTIKYNNDGERMIVCSSNKSCVLDSTSGECIRSFDGSMAFSVEIDSSETKAFFMGGKRIQIWDIQSGQCLRSFNEHDFLLGNPIALSKKGKRIATGYGNSISIWNVYSINKIKCAKTLVCGYGGADCACFSSDGNMLAVAVCTNNYICIWDINKETIVQEMKGHTSNIISITYSGDGKQIVTTSYDGSIRIWNAETGFCKHIISCSAKYAEFNHDNSKILSVTEGVRASIWDVETGMKIQDIDTPVDNAVFSPDGQSITITTDNTILIYPFIPYSKLIEQAYARYKDFLLTPEERKKYYLD
jgi:WD40 repeat protein